MAPRRNSNHHGHGHGHVEVQGLPIDPEGIENRPSVACCAPTECLMPGAPIFVDDLSDVAKVMCNNDHCNQGPFMHRECFDCWEQTVLTYLRSCGRARSWSEKQRLQNLWTKKGYDLAFKACSCKCGRGHLRKDLDWIPPKPAPNKKDEELGKKKRRRNKGNNKPALAVSTPQHHHHPNSQQQPAQGGNGTPTPTAANSPTAANTTPAATPPANATSNNNNNNNNSNNPSRNRANSVSSTGSSGGSSPGSPASPTEPFPGTNTGTKKKSKFEFFSDRSRHGSGSNSIFCRRLDFSSFNALPRHKLNSYHIKMEDEGNHGNDDTRCFILSTLAATKTCRTTCVLCFSPMIIFDRYPLIDGTFFLSPRQHNKSCLEVKVDGRIQYLSAVCMGCLEGWNVTLKCRYCYSSWDGSSLVLGTMYSYDIFAAIPCCVERLKCNSCMRLVVPSEHRLPFFSDYSRATGCLQCGLVDYHFVKPLASYLRKEQGQHSPLWC